MCNKKFEEDERSPDGERKCAIRVRVQKEWYWSRTELEY